MYSILRSYGYYSSFASVETGMGSPNEKEGKVWCCRGYELWRFVSLLLASSQTYKLIATSAGITALVKTSKIPAMRSMDNCKF